MRRALAPLLLLAAAACAGEEADLVVYCALDAEHSEPIVRIFEERTGLRVDLQTDTEQAKTVGLVQRLFQERERPRADVFWNNEIAHTIRLARAGLTVPYRSPAATGIPASFRDPDGHWTGFAARARIILHRTDLPADLQPPRRVADLIRPELAPHGGMAAPLTGTTLTHFAALSLRLGREPVLDWLRRAKESGLHIGRGNAHVMRQVREGDYGWCLTDTDDAAKARRAGYPVAILFPDQEEGGAGTLLIPNTICLIAGGPHPEAGRRFIDFVLSPEVEAMLAAGDSEQIPLHAGVAAPPGMKLPGRDFRPMEVDWEAVAEELEAVLPRFQELFTE
ncbi:MAG: extracellular solute-binding protein [Planctomycetota bacterium]|nr:MAG: extracellular solute-binding protein [Planctomycetota bacterium]